MKASFSSAGRRALVAFAIVVGLIALPRAKADLVYDNAAPTAPMDRGAARESTRQAINSSQRFRTGVSATTTLALAAPAPAAPATLPMAGEENVAPGVNDGGAEVQSLSRSELLRRERLREELKNEDAVQERLEELRLRDEQKRTNQLFGGKAQPEQQADMAAPAPAPMTGEEVIATPITDRPGQPAMIQTTAPMGNAMMGQPQAAPIQMAAPAGAYSPRNMAGQTAEAAAMPMSSNAYATGEASDDEKTIVRITPRIGVANMSDSGSFKVNSKKAMGIGLSIGASDTASFEVGYTYAEYGIDLDNGFSNQYYPGMPSNGMESRQLNQNVIDAGIKLSLLGRDSKIRPFVGGGGAWSKGYVNFSDDYIAYQQSMNPYYWNNSRDYEISSFLGYVSTGLDMKITRSVYATFQFKYYAVLSSSQNLQNGLPYNSAYGAQTAYGSPYYTPYNTASTTDSGNQQAGASLAKSNFYDVMGGVSFEF